MEKLKRSLKKITGAIIFTFICSFILYAQQGNQNGNPLPPMLELSPTLENIANCFQFLGRLSNFV